MLLQKDRKRRFLQYARLIVAVAIVVTIVFACMTSGEMKAELSEDSVLEMDGLYITFDGEITVTNGLNSGIDDATVVLSLNDVKENKAVEIWKGEHISIAPNSVAVIPVSFRISSFSVAAAVINSLQTVDSPLEIHAEVYGKCIYGLIKADVNADIGIPLAKEGKILRYTVDTNTSSEFKLSIIDLSDAFIPEDDVLTMTSGSTVMKVRMSSDDSGTHIDVTSNTDLDSAIDVLKTKVDSAVTDSGSEIDEGTAKYIVTAIEYARWFL